MPRYRWNRYNDLEVDISYFSVESEAALSILVHDETDRWKSEIKGRRGEMRAVLWVKIPENRIRFLPWFMCNGFTMHHATKDHVMVAKPRSPRAMIPLYGTHYARVECVVVEEGTGNVLLVKEGTGPDTSHKLITGSVDSNEYVSAAAVREVREETGVECTVAGVLGLGNRLCTRFGRDEILIGVLLNAKRGQTPRVDGSETLSAIWADPETAVRTASPMAREWLLSCLPMAASAIVTAASSRPLRRGRMPDFRGPPHSMEMSASSPDFFEKQNDRDCTVHSLNNAMGRVVVTKKQVLDYIDALTSRYAAEGHTADEVRLYRDKMAKDDTFFTADVVWNAAKQRGTIGDVTPVSGFGGAFADLDTLPTWVKSAHLVFLGLDPHGHPHAVGARNGVLYDSQRWANGPKPLTNDELKKALPKVLALFVVGEFTDKNKILIVRSQPATVSYSKRSSSMPETPLRAAFIPGVAAISSSPAGGHYSATEKLRAADARGTRPHKHPYRR